MWETVAWYSEIEHLGEYLNRIGQLGDTGRAATSFSKGGAPPPKLSKLCR